MIKKLFTKIKCRITAKGAARLAKRKRQEQYLRMAADVYKARMEAQKEADALRRAAKDTTDKPSSILD